MGDLVRMRGGTFIQAPPLEVSQILISLVDHPQHHAEALANDVELDMAPNQDVPAAQLFLHSLPITRRYFWTTELSDQLALTVTDYPRHKLSTNDLLVMALNEGAAHFGSGFFFHTPWRETFHNRSPSHPASRTEPVPGALYPSILYMDYAWSTRAQDSFWSQSHQARYLKCDGRVNPPPDLTPLYGMQCLSWASQPVYAAGASLIVSQTNSSLFVCTSTELEAMVGRHNNRKHKALGPDPHLRLNQPREFWADVPPDPVESRYRWLDLQDYRVPSLEQLYNAIVTRCGRDVQPTFTARYLREQVLPRPSDPEQGTALGHLDT